tara:strand:+ start:103 stop:279 length:177 start_codon:yes stop_codon:yes gene_type:complete
LNSPDVTDNREAEFSNDLNNYNSAKNKPKIPVLDFSSLHSNKSQKIKLKEEETIKKIN